MPDRHGPEHWLAQARQARAEAEQFTDPKARRMMLAIARNYEELAKAATKHAARATRDKG